MKKRTTAVFLLAFLISVVGILGFAQAMQMKDVTKKESSIKAVDLNGVWKNNDGGYYYIRQIGNTIWWSGMSNNGAGTTWSNVFKGTLNGDVVSGDWSDVPRGSILSFGQISLRVYYTNTGVQLRKTYSTGGFGGSLWYK